MYYASNAGIKGGVSEKTDINKWYSSEEFLREKGVAYFAVFKGTEMYLYYVFDTESDKEAGYSNMMKYQKDKRKGVLYVMDMRK
jgi:L-rhamnose mutarotase